MAKGIQYSTVLATIGVAYLYFVGWMYLFYYLLYFGIDITSVEIEFLYVLMYYFAVIGNFVVKLLSWYLSKSAVFQIIFFFAVVFLVIVLCTFLAFLISTATKHVFAWFKGSRSYFVKSTSFVSVVFGIVVVFLLGHELARSEAFEYATDLRFDRERRVEVIFRKKMIDSLYIPDEDRRNEIIGEFQRLAETDRGSRVKLLFSTKNKIFVLVQPVESQADGANFVLPARVIALNVSDGILIQHIVGQESRP